MTDTLTRRPYLHPTDRTLLGTAIGAALEKQLPHTINTLTTRLIALHLEHWPHQLDAVTNHIRTLAQQLTTLADTLDHKPPTQ